MFKISEKDPQLQLALALSMSLHEAQMSEEIEEAHLLEGEPFFPINGEISEERRKTLQNFGFTTNKPAVAACVSNKSRKSMLSLALIQKKFVKHFVDCDA